MQNSVVGKNSKELYVHNIIMQYYKIMIISLSCLRIKSVDMHVLGLIM